MVRFFVASVTGVQAASVTGVRNLLLGCQAYSLLLSALTDILYFAPEGQYVYHEINT